MLYITHMCCVCVCLESLEENDTFQPQDSGYP